MGKYPVAKEGFPFILICLVGVVLLWVTGFKWFELFMAPLTVFVIAFFRDPDRTAPTDKNAVISPADGLIIKIDNVRDTRFLNADTLRICIFMNVFNVHVNRVPFEGVVKGVIYNPGKFFKANLDKASMDNEQNAVIVETKAGRRYAFNQIAGLIARRIVCYAKPGMSYSRGERFGLIRFGSRVDVYLPVNCKAAVKVGDKVRAGSTIVGHWNA